ncbi:MAG: redox-regulated ATPase YchF [Candidatus Woesearchaeota archaeon]
MAEVEIANFPFTTIKPNVGVAFVKTDCAEKYFGVKCNPRIGYCIDGKRFVPVRLMDVAGLVPGAHKGLGMGSQFLDDLRQAHVLIHVVDISGSVNEKGEPVEPLSYDPLNDVLFLEEELDYWYTGILKKGWDKLARQVQQEKGQLHKVLGKQLTGLGIDEKMIERTITKMKLDAEKPINWTEEQLFQLARNLRIESKPMIIAANKIDVQGAEKNFARLKEKFPEYVVVSCSAESEVALKLAAKNNVIKYIPGASDFEIISPKKLSDSQKNALEFIRENVVKKYSSTGVQEVLDTAVFKYLKYVAVFPGGVNKLQDQHGNVLPDCFLLPQNSTALDFAYKLHTDLGKNFVRAIDVKTKRTVGKEHILTNGDVIEIITSK